MQSLRWFSGRLVGSHAALFGFGTFLFLLVVAVLAPWIAPFGPNEVAGDALGAPGAAHLLGTDNIGRDVLSVIVFGTRSALIVGVSSALIALVLGALVGGTAAFAGGKTGAWLMRVAELFQILPLIILVLFVVALWGSNLWLLILAVAIAVWPHEARIVYGQVKSIRERDYVHVARIAGLSSTRIILREVLPNALPPVIVQVALDAGLAVLIQAGLGFLGLGDPKVADWGQLLFAAQNYLYDAWWMSVFPGLAIFLTILMFGVLGDGINDIYNPRRTRAKGMAT